MNSLRLFTLTIVMNFAVTVSAQYVEEGGADAEILFKINQASGKLISDLSKSGDNIKVGIADFTGNSGKSCSFGSLLAEELLNAIADTDTGRHLILIERKNLKALLKESDLKEEGYLDPASVRKLFSFRSLGCDVLITGSLSEMNSSIRILIRAIQTLNGTVISAVGISFSKSEDMMALFKGCGILAPPIIMKPRSVNAEQRNNKISADGVDQKIMNPGFQSEISNQQGSSAEFWGSSTHEIKKNAATPSLGSSAESNAIPEYITVNDQVMPATSKSEWSGCEYDNTGEIEFSNHLSFTIKLTIYNDNHSHMDHFYLLPGEVRRYRNFPSGWYRFHAFREFKNRGSWSPATRGKVVFSDNFRVQSCNKSKIKFLNNTRF